MGDLYCVRGLSGRRRLARRAAHGRGAVGAGALPHGQSAGQLQLQVLEEGGGDDLGCLWTFARAPRQHAAHHAQLQPERKTRVSEQPHIQRGGAVELQIMFWDYANLITR